MGHTGSSFTVAYKTRYASIQRSLSQAKQKKTIKRKHIPRKNSQKWPIDVFEKLSLSETLCRLMAQKTQLRLWPTTGVFETSKEIVVLSPFLSEKNQETQSKKQKKVGIFLPTSPTLASSSPGPNQPESLSSSNTGMYR